MIHNIENNLCLKKDIIQVGITDKIGVNIVYKKGRNNKKGHKKDIVFMLPGANTDFWTSFSEVAKYLALRDIDVYGIDFRHSFTSDCNNGCTFMKKWDTNTYLSDIDRAINEAGILPSNIILLGFSMGAYYAYKYTEKHPELKGIIPIEIAYTLEPITENISLINATHNEIKRIKNSNIYYEDMSASIYMANLTQNAPDKQSPIIEGMTNKQAFLLTVTATHQFGFSVPNYRYAQGDLNNLKYTNYDLIIKKALALNPFQSVVPTTELYNQWTQNTVPIITIPTLYLGAECGFGSIGLYVPNIIKLYNSNVKSHIIEDYGHADIVWAKDNKSKYLIYEWIKKLS